MRKQAWKDAREDYLIEKALHRKILWRLFWTITLLGLGYRFFGVEACNESWK
jgi:hypothetical protein